MIDEIILVEGEIVEGGVTDYPALNDKPTINGVEVNGNMTSEDLKIKQDYTADDILFADGTTFQQKYDSGELKGEPGQDGQPGKDGIDGHTPVKGVDYFDGADGAPGNDGTDGVSCTHSWDGTILTVTSASGTSSVDLKGEPGADGQNGADGAPGSDGYTPVKGTDYFTEEDKQEMVTLVLAALPSAEEVSY